MILMNMPLHCTSLSNFYTKICLKTTFNVTTLSLNSKTYFFNPSKIMEAQWLCLTCHIITSLKNLNAKKSVSISCIQSNLEYMHILHIFKDIFFFRIAAWIQILTAIASLLDWISKLPDSQPLQAARDKAQYLIQNPYLSYDTAHEHILKTTRDLGTKNYFLIAQEMEDDQRKVELDSIYFHISTYTKSLNLARSS